MFPTSEEMRSMGGTPFARESSKIHTWAPHGRKWCPGFQNHTPCSQNGAQWSQNEPTIVAKVIQILQTYDTNVILLSLPLLSLRVWWELHQAKHKPFDPDSPHTCCGTWVCRLFFPSWLGVFLSAPNECWYG